jgi:Family of unknown function (DUF5367)
MSVQKTLSLCAMLGFVLWLIVTVVFRFTGHMFFDPANSGLMIGLYAAIIPVMMILTFVIYLILRVPPSGHSLASSSIALPGMLLSAAIMPFYSTILPNMNPAADALFGGWLMLAYASVLLTPYVFRKKKKQAI